VATPRKIALRFLWALLSVSLLFNSPAQAELAFCLGQDCESESLGRDDSDHPANDPCQSAAESRQETALHSHERADECESCIQLSLLHQAGDAIRPAPAPDHCKIALPITSGFGPDFHRPAFRSRPLTPSPLHLDPLRSHLRTVRLLI
jgi:hypothetical protein